MSDHTSESSRKPEAPELSRPREPSVAPESSKSPEPSVASESPDSSAAPSVSDSGDAVPEPPKGPAHAQQGWQPHPPPNPWQSRQQQAGTVARLRPAPPVAIRNATLWSVVATALLSGLLLGTASA